MIHLKTLLVASLVLASASWAHAFEKIASDQPTTLSADRLLVTTHASKDWDGYARSKAGLDSAVSKIKALGGQVYYIVYGDQNYVQRIASGDSSFFFQDLDPTAYLYNSDQGEHMLRLAGKQIYWTGGYFESCSSASVSRALTDIANDPSSVPEFNYVMDGLYTTCPDLPHITVTSPDDQFPETAQNTISLSQCLRTIIPANERLDFLKVYFSDVIPLRIQEMWRGIDGIANVRKWYPVLPPVSKFTFDVWFDSQHLGTVGTGPIVLRANFFDAKDIR